MPRLKALDFPILKSVQMAKHRCLAEYIESETGVKIDPVVIALVVALRNSNWRSSDVYFEMQRELRAKASERDKPTGRPVGRPRVRKIEEVVEVEEVIPKRKRKIKDNEIAKRKPAKRKAKAINIVSEDETVFDD